MPYRRMDDVREKLKWAKHHIGNVKASIKEFTDTQPYEVGVEQDTESGELFVHVLKADPIPPAIRLGCGDAIQTLRSTLDYLTCALVRANGKSPSSQVEFPIFEHLIENAEDRKNFDRKVKGMRDEAREQILLMKPYQGGDNTLWRLHRLNRIDKHNMLVTALGNITAINGLPPIGDRWNGNRWVGIPGIPLGIKVGDKFTPAVKVARGAGFFAEVVFDEPDIAEGYPVVLALIQFHRRVMEVCGELSWALR